MTKEITKAIILQEIQDKFKLRELIPGKFTFSEEVIPVYNIAQHLGAWTVKEQTKSITGLGGTYFFTVPDDEFWTLRAYMPIFGATGAHTMAGVYLSGRPVVGDLIYLDLKAGQDVSYLVNLPVPVQINAGTTIAMNCDGYTSTQSVTLHIDVLVEEVR